MQFQETVVTTPSDVVAAIASYATALKWTVTSAAGTATLTQPVSAVNPSPVALTVASPNPTTSGGAITITAAANVAAAVSWAPRNAGNTGWMNPVKASIFGGAAAGPWLACVVHYAFNQYRHIYIGSMEFLGALTGGEVFACSNSPPSDSLPYFDTPHNWFDFETNSYSNGVASFGVMFGGGRSSDGYNASPNGGGARIVHPNNPSPWRQFAGPRLTGPPTSGNSIYGGVGDALNDGFFWRANNNFAGAQVLVPFNLYASLASGQFVPVGIPAGVRHVDMTSVAPEQTLVLGSTNWRAFPQISKTADAGPMFFQSGTQNPVQSYTESSGPFGLAYTENSP